MFSRKKSGTKTGATISNNYHIQLKNRICCRKNQQGSFWKFFKFQRKAPVLEVFLMLQAWGPLKQVLFCEICEIFKNTYF